MTIISVKVNDEFRQMIPERVWRKTMRDAFQQIGQLWHSKHRPFHFMPAAFRLYGYLPRSRRTREAKRRAGIPDNPLVWTGDTKARSASKTIRASKNRGSGGYKVTITMPVQKLNFRPKRGRINMREEFTEIAPSEEREYEQLVVRMLENEVNKRQRKRGRPRKIRT